MSSNKKAVKVANNKKQSPPEKWSELTPEQLQEVSGTDSHKFAQRLLAHSGLSSSLDLASDEQRSAGMALAKEMIKSLAPENGLQAMIVAQMISVHSAQMMMSIDARTASDPTVKNSYTNMSIKLSNTFIQQASTLSKLQGKGQQKVRVEHVNVEAGGQAIVGIVDSGLTSGVCKKA